MIAFWTHTRIFAENKLCVNNIYDAAKVQPSILGAEIKVRVALISWVEEGLLAYDELMRRKSDILRTKFETVLKELSGFLLNC